MVGAQKEAKAEEATTQAVKKVEEALPFAQIIEKITRSPQVGLMERASQRASMLLEHSRKVKSTLDATPQKTTELQIARLLQRNTVLAQATEAEKRRIESIRGYAGSAIASLKSGDLRQAADSYQTALSLELINHQINMAKSNPAFEHVGVIYRAAFITASKKENLKASALIRCADLNLHGLHTKDANEQKNSFELAQTIYKAKKMDEGAAKLAVSELNSRLAMHQFDNKRSESSQKARDMFGLAADFYRRGEMFRAMGEYANKLAVGYIRLSQLKDPGKAVKIKRFLDEKSESLKKLQKTEDLLAMHKNMGAEQIHNYWQNEFTQLSVEFAKLGAIGFREELSDSAKTLGVNNARGLIESAVSMYLEATKGEAEGTIHPETQENLTRAAKGIHDCLYRAAEMKRLGLSSLSGRFLEIAGQFAKAKEGTVDDQKGTLAGSEIALLKAEQSARVAIDRRNIESARKKYLGRTASMARGLAGMERRVGSAVDPNGNRIFTKDKFQEVLDVAVKKIKGATSKAEMDEVMISLGSLQKDVQKNYELAETVSNLTRARAEIHLILYGDEKKNEPGILGMYRQVETTRKENAAGMSRQAMAEVFRTEYDLRKLAENIQAVPLDSTLKKVYSGKATAREVERVLFAFQAHTRRFQAFKKGYSFAMPALQQAVSSANAAASMGERTLIGSGMKKKSDQALQAVRMFRDGAIMTAESGALFPSSLVPMKHQRYRETMVFRFEGRIYVVNEASEKVGKQYVNAHKILYTISDDFAYYKGTTTNVINDKPMLFQQANIVMQNAYRSAGDVGIEVYSIVANEQASEQRRLISGQGDPKHSQLLDRALGLLDSAQVSYEPERAGQFTEMVRRSAKEYVRSMGLIRDSRRDSDLAIEVKSLQDKAGRLDRDIGIVHENADKAGTRRKKQAHLNEARRLTGERNSLYRKIEKLKQERSKLEWVKGKQIPDYSGTVKAFEDFLAANEQRIERDVKSEQVAQAVKGIGLLATMFMGGGIGMAVWGADIFHNIHVTKAVHAAEIAPFVLSLITHGASNLVQLSIKTAETARLMGISAEASRAMMPVRGITAVKMTAGINVMVGTALASQGLLFSAQSFKGDASDYVTMLQSLVMLGMPIAVSARARMKVRQTILDNPVTLKDYRNKLIVEEFYHREGAGNWKESYAKDPKAAWAKAKEQGYRGSETRFMSSLEQHHNTRVVEALYKVQESKVSDAYDSARAQGFIGTKDDFISAIHMRKQQVVSTSLTGMIASFENGMMATRNAFETTYTKLGEAYPELQKNYTREQFDFMLLKYLEKPQGTLIEFLNARALMAKESAKPWTEKDMRDFYATNASVKENYTTFAEFRLMRNMYEASPGGKTFYEFMNLKVPKPAEAAPEAVARPAEATQAKASQVTKPEVWDRRVAKKEYKKLTKEQRKEVPFNQFLARRQAYERNPEGTFLQFIGIEAKATAIPPKQLPTAQIRDQTKIGLTPEETLTDLHVRAARQAIQNRETLVSGEDIVKTRTGREVHRNTERWENGKIFNAVQTALLEMAGRRNLDVIAIAFDKSGLNNISNMPKGHPIADALSQQVFPAIIKRAMEILGQKRFGPLLRKRYKDASMVDALLGKKNCDERTWFIALEGLGKNQKRLKRDIEAVLTQAKKDIMGRLHEFKVVINGKETTVGAWMEVNTQHKADLAVAFTADYSKVQSLRKAVLSDMYKQAEAAGSPHAPAVARALGIYEGGPLKPRAGFDGKDGVGQALPGIPDGQVLAAGTAFEVNLKLRPESVPKVEAALAEHFNRIYNAGFKSGGEKGAIAELRSRYPPLSEVNIKDIMAYAKAGRIPIKQFARIVTRKGGLFETTGGFSELNTFPGHDATNAVAQIIVDSVAARIGGKQVGGRSLGNLCFFTPEIRAVGELRLIAADIRKALAKTGFDVEVQAVNVMKGMSVDDVHARFLENKYKVKNLDAKTKQTGEQLIRILQAGSDEVVIKALKRAPLEVLKLREIIRSVERRKGEPEARITRGRRDLRRLRDVLDYLQEKPASQQALIDFARKNVAQIDAAVQTPKPAPQKVIRLRDYFHEAGKGALEGFRKTFKAGGIRGETLTGLTLKMGYNTIMGAVLKVKALRAVAKGKAMPEYSPSKQETAFLKDRNVNPKQVLEEYNAARRENNYKGTLEEFFEIRQSVLRTFPEAGQVAVHEYTSVVGTYKGNIKEFKADISEVSVLLVAMYAKRKMDMPKSSADQIAAHLLGSGLGKNEILDIVKASNDLPSVATRLEGRALMVEGRVAGEIQQAPAKPADVKTLTKELRVALRDYNLLKKNPDSTTAEILAAEGVYETALKALSRERPDVPIKQLEREALGIRAREIETKPAKPSKKSLENLENELLIAESDVRRIEAELAKLGAEKDTPRRAAEEHGLRMVLKKNYPNKPKRLSTVQKLLLELDRKTADMIKIRDTAVEARKAASTDYPKKMTNVENDIKRSPKEERQVFETNLKALTQRADAESNLPIAQRHIQNFLKGASESEIMLLVTDRRINLAQIPSEYFALVSSEVQVQNPKSFNSMIDKMRRIPNDGVRNAITGVIALRTFRAMRSALYNVPSNLKMVTTIDQMGYPTNLVHAAKFLRRFGIDPKVHKRMPWARVDLMRRAELFHRVERFEGELTHALNRAFPGKETQIKALVQEMAEKITVQDVNDTGLQYTPHGWQHSLDVLDIGRRIYGASPLIRKTLIEKFGSNERAMAAMDFANLLHDIGYGKIAPADSKGKHPALSGQLFKTDIAPKLAEILGVDLSKYALSKKQLSARPKENLTATVDLKGRKTNLDVERLVAENDMMREVFDAINLHAADKPAKKPFQQASDTENPLLYISRLADNLDMLSSRLRNVQSDPVMLEALSRMYTEGEAIRGRMKIRRRMGEKGWETENEFKARMGAEVDNAMPGIKKEYTITAKMAKAIREGELAPESLPKFAQGRSLDDALIMSDLLNRLNDGTWAHFIGCERVTGFTLEQKTGKNGEPIFVVTVNLKGKLKDLPTTVDAEVSGAAYQIWRADDAFKSLFYSKNIKDEPYIEKREGGKYIVAANGIKMRYIEEVAPARRGPKVTFAMPAVEKK